MVFDEAPGREARVVLARAGALICALPVLSVSETMRALPIRPARGGIPFVLGVAVIRGAALPVLDLAAFLGAGAGSGQRFVVVRAGPRQLALSVDEVLGVSRLEASTLERAPPLLDRALAEHVEGLGALDHHVVVLLRAARLLPDEAWALAAD